MSAPAVPPGPLPALEYDVRVAGRDVDVRLRVGGGETVALLGPNGAGKSTVLGVVAGLLRPTSGRVALGGRTLSAAGRGEETHLPPHRRRTAMLAQDPLLFPHLSARDNVAFGPRSAGRSRAQARATAEHWLQEVGVASLADRRPGELSGGQAQRVAVARALAADPDLLLLDEPMAALDVAVTPALRQALRRVLAGRTVLLVTHDALDALLLADRVVVLEDGRVVEEGPTGSVLSRPRSRFAARVAGLNLVTGTWRDGAVETTDGLRVAGRPLADAGPEGTPAPGAPAVAVFPPAAVSVFLERPVGSPRTALPVRVSAVEPHGGAVRVRAGDLVAEVTPQAVAELDLVPGSQAVFVVKATEVAVHPAHRVSPAVPVSDGRGGAGPAGPAEPGRPPGP